MINKKYGDFLPSLQGSEELMVQVDDVSKEMDVLNNCIRNEVCMKTLKVVNQCLTREEQPGFKSVFVYTNTGAAEYPRGCG